MFRTRSNLLEELITQAAQEFPGLEVDFLGDAIYSTSLTAKQQQQFTQFIDFIRTRQDENAVYEKTYQHLLHLYVLNGSRLDTLKTIDRRLRGLTEGQGSLLLIGGESGIGKTSLVMAFQERIHQLGTILISGQCSEQERSSYAIWQKIARSASAEGFSLDALPAPLGTGPEAQSPQHLKQALLNWFESCTDSQRLVILLDDLHWADEDSLEVLNYLTSQLATIPVLFVATYRSEENHLQYALNDHLSQLQRNRVMDLILLEPLTRTDLARFVTAKLGNSTPGLLAYLHERAEGHPLFTVELLHDLVTHDLLIQDAQGGWLPPAESSSMPVYLKQLITQRISNLGDNVEQLLSIAAVVGEAWPLKIIEPLVEITEDELLEALEHALQAGIIIVEEDQAEIYRFSHSLIRELLYTRQLSRRRKRIHAQIALQYEQLPPKNVFAIAFHSVEGEQWPKAVNDCLAAGDQAIRQFAFYSGLQWYQQALDAAERGRNELSPAIQLAIYARLGQTYRALEHRREAELVYSRMRDFAQSHDDLVAEGQALVNLAAVRIIQYQSDLAEKTAYEALKIGEQTNDIRLLTQIHGCLGGLYIYRGQLTRAIHHLQEAQARAETLDEPVMMNEVLKLWGYITIWAGQYREAETYSQSLLKNAQKSIDPTVKLSGFQNLGWAQLETGQYHQAYLNFLTGIEMYETAEEHHHIHPRLLNMMGYLYLELGDPQEALGWDQRALAASWLDPSHGNYEMRRYSLLNMATDYLHLGYLEKAQETIAQFEAIKEAAASVRFRYFNRYQLLMCETNLVQEQFSQAIEWAQEARSLAQSNDISKNIAKSHWFEGQAFAGLRQFDAAFEHLEKAAEIADSIQHGSLRWKIRLSLSEALQKARKPTDEVIRQTRSLIDETLQGLAGSPLLVNFMASSWIEKIEILEQSPILVLSEDYPAILTTREIEVLQLVANGASNQQVADILHISVRTVNTHMTNILNKTGCDNRTAASVYAIQHNLVTT